MIERAAGLLLHPTSLPGPFGIGDLGPGADAFIDWAASAGQKVWQVLPLGPTAYDNSPYGTLSAFAGNPLLIAAARLVEEGYLAASALEEAPRFSEGGIKFSEVIAWKDRMLRASWSHFQAHAPRGARQRLEQFAADPVHAFWLDDWTLFMAIKSRFGGREWQVWDADLVRRRPEALAAARVTLAEEVDYHRYLQFLFFGQWRRVKERANRSGIRIMGDVPIYVAPDSADAWANARLFAIDEKGNLESVAGVPPDYFSATGQRWGNPLYRWDRMEAEGFRWWIERVRSNLVLADYLRVDHFRGFAAYWEIPGSESTAEKGRWAEGPGAKLFEAIRRELGDVTLVAEDLGHITPDVVALRKALGIPGMKVLQFAFGEPDSEDLPHRHDADFVVYTGTHDNNTTRGWFDGLVEADRARALEYLKCGEGEVVWEMIRAAYGSKAALAIVPVQDVFGLGADARMNTPGVATGNWSWRARTDQFRTEIAARLQALAAEHHR